MPEIYGHAGRYPTPERSPEAGSDWVRSPAAVDLAPGVPASPMDPETSPESNPQSHRTVDPADRAPLLPHTPPIVDDVNFVVVAEREWHPATDEEVANARRLVAQLRRSWAVSRRRSTG
jgi:hypothetical protein